MSNGTRCFAKGPVYEFGRESFLKGSPRLERQNAGAGVRSNGGNWSMARPIAELNASGWGVPRDLGVRVPREVLMHEGLNEVKNP